MMRVPILTAVLLGILVAQTGCQVEQRRTAPQWHAEDPNLHFKRPGDASSPVRR